MGMKSGPDFGDRLTPSESVKVIPVTLLERIKVNLERALARRAKQEVREARPADAEAVTFLRMMRNCCVDFFQSGGDARGVPVEA